MGGDGRAGAASLRGESLRRARRLGRHGGLGLSQMRRQTDSDCSASTQDPVKKQRARRDSVATTAGALWSPREGTAEERPRTAAHAWRTGFELHALLAGRPSLHSMTLRVKVERAVPNCRPDYRDEGTQAYL